MSFLTYLLQFIYPPRCVLCDNLLAIHETEKLCVACDAKLVFISGATCPRCGFPLNSFAGYCANCRKHPPVYTKNISPYLYDDRVKTVIYRFKYDGQFAAGYFLAARMFDYALQKDPSFFDAVDILIPVPLHKKRRHERGFNQAEILAAIIGKKANRPVLQNALIRHKKTAPQSSLKTKQRAANIRGAIRVFAPSKIQGKVAVIIDDILTTGSTLNACAEALLSSGAKDVLCLTASLAAHSATRNSDEQQ